MRFLFGCLVLMFGLAACSNESETQSGREDYVEREAPLPQDYDLTRIVVLGGPATELVYAFGLGDNVVGTDQSSLWPAEIHEKPRLGFYRQASAEGILSLDPTVIVALDEFGPESVVQQIESAGVPIIILDEVDTLEEAEARVEEFGQHVGMSDSAQAVLADMSQDFAAAEALLPETAPRAMFIYTRGVGLVLASGTGTSADEVLKLAGAENAVSSFADFQPLTAEAVAEASPGVIVIPARGLESLGGLEGLMSQPGLAQTPAGQAGHVIAVDDALLLGLGPRVGEGVAELAAQFSAITTEPAQ